MWFFWWRSPLSCARLCCTVCPTFKQLFVAVYCQRIKSVAAVGFFCLFVCLFFWAVWSHLISVEKNLFLIHGFLSHSLTSSLIYFLHWNLKKKKKGFRSTRDSSTGQACGLSVLTWIGLFFPTYRSVIVHRRRIVVPARLLVIQFNQTSSGIKNANKRLWWPEHLIREKKNQWCI